MNEVVMLPADSEFDPEIVARYPIARIFDYQGFQVVIGRETGLDDSPAVAATFPTGQGICTAKSPYPATQDGSERRDEQYAEMIGHQALPEYLVELIKFVWEDKGRPPSTTVRAV